jgi:hypothetical protein
MRECDGKDARMTWDFLNPTGAVESAYLNTSLCRLLLNIYVRCVSTMGPKYVLNCATIPQVASLS